MLDGSFQLFDVLGSTFSKGCLSLTIPLLSFFRCGVYLQCTTRQRPLLLIVEPTTHWLSSSLPFLNLSIFLYKTLFICFGRGLRKGALVRMLSLRDRHQVLDIGHVRRRQWVKVPATTWFSLSTSSRSGTAGVRGRCTSSPAALAALNRAGLDDAHMCTWAWELKDDGQD